MSVVAPPEPPRPDELEALIREARARQRRRWIQIVTAVAAAADRTTDGGVHWTVTGPLKRQRNQHRC
jgi:hypothetical protein